MFSSGKSLKATTSDIQGKVTEGQLLSYYLGITEVPCVICNPTRDDKHPSLGIYSPDGEKIRYKDYARKDCGGIYDLLGSMWGTDYLGVLSKIYKDLPKITTGCSIEVSCKVNKRDTYNANSNLECSVREWKQYDLDYWYEYGITKEWLEYAEVFPISHKIVVKNGKRYVFAADKYAYAFVERKDGKVSLKIYQPFNKDGYKWANKNNGSVIGLWTKIPECGMCVCICSSLKDALCLWANSGIPCVFLQGEGYNMSSTAVNNLKGRYQKIYVCFDNDETGLEDGKKLSEEHGFINVVLPHFTEGKDISDFMKAKGVEEFIRVLKPLFS